MEAKEGGHPHPGGVRLRRLPQDLHAEEDPAAAPALPLRREAVLVSGVLKDVRPEEEPPSAQAVPHRREAVRVPQVRQKLPSEGKPEDACALPHWREAVQLQHLRQDVQDREKPGEAPLSRRLCSFLQDHRRVVAAAGKKSFLPQNETLDLPKEVSQDQRDIRDRLVEGINTAKSFYIVIPLGFQSFFVFFTLNELNSFFCLFFLFILLFLNRPVPFLPV